jgi:hypothetical protein
MTSIARCLFGVSVVAVTIGVPLAAPPLAGAGCQSWGLTRQLCDDPLKPDGTWQRCMIDTWNPNYTNKECYTLGGNHFLPPFEPPGHIDP